MKILWLITQIYSEWKPQERKISLYLKICNWITLSLYDHMYWALYVIMPSTYNCVHALWYVIMTSIYDYMYGVMYEIIPGIIQIHKKWTDVRLPLSSKKKLHRRNKIVRRETLVIRRMFLHYMFERILGMQKMILIDIQKLNRIKREREHPQKYFAWKYQSIRK